MRTRWPERHKLLFLFLLVVTALAVANAPLAGGTGDLIGTDPQCEPPPNDGHCPDQDDETRMPTDGWSEGCVYVNQGNTTMQALTGHGQCHTGILDAVLGYSAQLKDAWWDDAAGIGGVGFTVTKDDGGEVWDMCYHEYNQDIFYIRLAVDVATNFGHVLKFTSNAKAGDEVRLTVDGVEFSVVASDDWTAAQLNSAIFFALKAPETLGVTDGANYIKFWPYDGTGVSELIIEVISAGGLSLPTSGIALSRFGSDDTECTEPEGPIGGGRQLL